jgi:hypothetical protein
VNPRRAGALAVGAALAVVGLWFARRQAPSAPSISDATLSIIVTQHDALGVPSKPVIIRERRQVRAVVESLGADTQKPIPCPPDYAAADIGLLLTGSDVYARRNAYVWDIGSSPRVVIVDETGCRGGLVRDAGRLRSELRPVNER